MGYRYVSTIPSDGTNSIEILLKLIEGEEDELVIRYICPSRL